MVVWVVIGKPGPVLAVFDNEVAANYFAQDAVYAPQDGTTHVRSYVVGDSTPRQKDYEKALAGQGLILTAEGPRWPMELAEGSHQAVLIQRYIEGFLHCVGNQPGRFCPPYEFSPGFPTRELAREYVHANVLRNR